MKDIDKKISLKASAEKVWKVLTEDQHTKIWYKEFHEDSNVADTDWKLGSKAIFGDNNGNGMVGRITQSTPFRIIEIEYDGMLINGKEDYESDFAKGVKGGKERYLLSESNGTTLLAVEIEGALPPSMIEEMNEAWDRALIKVKALAEAL